MNENISKIKKELSDIIGCMDYQIKNKDTILFEDKNYPYNDTNITNKEKKFVVKGIVQRANTPNGNKRRYRKYILEREVNKYIEKIKNNTSDNAGELDHPDENTVRLSNSSHRFLDLWWEGDELWGEVEILNSPSGLILQELFNKGIKVGISSRGTGSVLLDEETGIEDVQDDFELICWDFVSNPSTQGAWMTILKENKDKISEVKVKIWNDINKNIKDIINILEN